MGRRAVVVVTTALASLVAPASAPAHGPCECTSPDIVEPGQRIRTGRAYKVIWNPAPRDFKDQTTPADLASGFRSDAPSEVVLRRPRTRPLPRAAFRVPQGTPPGIYFVLVFDGSEGGAHTTWDYVQVRGRPKAQTEGAQHVQSGAGDDGSRGMTAVLGVGGVALLAAAGLAVSRRRRRMSRP